MESNDTLLIVALFVLPYISRPEVWRVCMSWVDVHRGAAIAVAIIAVPLIMGWRKFND